MNLPEYPGYRSGWTGSSGGTLAGFQRVARSQGEPEPTRVEGRKGQGRADRLRAYWVTVTRVADGASLTRCVGPAYWPKKRWSKEVLAAQRALLARLGMRSF